MNAKAQPYPDTPTPSIRDSIRSALRASETASAAHALTDLSSIAVVRGNQNEPEMTVKDLANDSRESDLDGSRKMQFLVDKGGAEQTVLEMPESFASHEDNSRTFVDRDRHLQN